MDAEAKRTKRGGLFSRHSGFKEFEDIEVTGEKR